MQAFSNCMNNEWFELLPQTFRGYAQLCSFAPKDFKSAYKHEYYTYAHVDTARGMVVGLINNRQKGIEALCSH